MVLLAADLFFWRCKNLLVVLNGGDEQNSNLPRGRSKKTRVEP
jgi:hypothetical protein